MMGAPPFATGQEKASMWGCVTCW